MALYKKAGVNPMGGCFANVVSIPGSDCHVLLFSRLQLNCVSKVSYGQPTYQHLIQFGICRLPFLSTEAMSAFSVC